MITWKQCEIRCKLVLLTNLVAYALLIGTKIGDKYCAATGKRCGIGCKLVLFTNIKTYMGDLELLNNLERHDDRRRALSLR